MRTVKFYFQIPAELGPAFEEFLSSLAAAGVEMFRLNDGGVAAGIGLAGEYELVAMASQRVRKFLRSRDVSYREEEERESEGGATPATLFPTLSKPVSQPAARRPESAQPPAARPGKDDNETEEGEASTTPEPPQRTPYGLYPQLPGSSGRSPRGKRPVSADDNDPDLEKAHQKLVNEDEFGFSRLSHALSSSERKSLAFERALRSGVSFYRLGLYEDAERRLLAAARLRRDHAETHHYLGLVYDQMGTFDKAERHFRQAIRIDPDVGSSHFYLGNVYQKQGKFDKAIAEYKLAIEQDPQVPIVYNNLAWVFYQSGDQERSIRAFEETIAMEPDLPFPHNGLACVYLELGAFPDAVSEFKKALELYPEYAAAHLKLGWCLLQMNDIPNAIEEFKAVLETSDDSEYTLSANYSLGHSYLAQGQLLEAREAFHKVVLEEDEEFVDAILHLGVIQLRLGFADEAIDLLKRFRRQVSEDEAAPDVQKYLAQAYFQLDRYGQAMAACRKVLEKTTDDAEVYELMGQIEGFQNKWSAALKHLKRSLELAPESASAHFHMGWVHENRGETLAAIESYKSAIARNPDSSEAYSSLGWLYLEQGKREEALVIFEKALELSPRDIGLLNNLGWLYSMQGKYDEALQYYQRALQVEPDSSMLRCNVGTLYMHMGRRDEAEREWRRALKLNNDTQASANAHYYLGVLCGPTQQKDALDHFNRALELDPDMSAAYFRLAEALLAGAGTLTTRTLSQARRALERYLELEPQGEFSTQARQLLAERFPRAAGKPGKATQAAILEAPGAKKARAPVAGGSSKRSQKAAGGAAVPAARAKRAQ